VFERTTTKLEDAQTILDNLKGASDALTFRSSFNSFLSAARAITNALQKEGDKIKGFDDWYSKKQEQMKKDETLRFIHDARTEDFHEGKHKLRFGTYISHFSSKQAGSRPADSLLSIQAEGPFWVVDKGTPKERRIPIKKGGSWTIQVSIENAPINHLGEKLEKNDPLTICQLALEYFGNLVYEAKDKFGDSR
jgi:hypothetical protein